MFTKKPLKTAGAKARSLSWRQVGGHDICIFNYTSLYLYMHIYIYMCAREWEARQSGRPGEKDGVTGACLLTLSDCTLTMVPLTQELADATAIVSHLCNDYKKQQC